LGHWQFQTKKTQRARMGERQEIETLICEEALLFAQYLRNERDTWVPRIVRLTWKKMVEISPDVPSKSWLCAVSDIPLRKRGSLSDRRYSSVVCVRKSHLWYLLARYDLSLRRWINQMKHSWIVPGLLLLLIANVSFLFYLLTQGAVMSVPLLLLLWLLLFGIFALVGCIAWLAGWLPRKKKSWNSATW
jgi:hypothetical protein